MSTCLTFSLFTNCWIEDTIYHQSKHLEPIGFPVKTDDNLCEHNGGFLSMNPKMKEWIFSLSITLCLFSSPELQRSCKTIKRAVWAFRYGTGILNQFKGIFWIVIYCNTAFKLQMGFKIFHGKFPSYHNKIKLCFLWRIFLGKTTQFDFHGKKI